MALRVTTGVLPEWYTTKAEEARVTAGEVKAEEARAYFIRPLNGPEQLIVQDECYDPVKKNLTGRGYTQVVSYGLVKWKNVLDDKSGEQVEYTGSKDIGLLPLGEIAELAAKIISISKFSEVDRKNS